MVAEKETSVVANTTSFPQSAHSPSTRRIPIMVNVIVRDKKSNDSDVATILATHLIECASDLSKAAATRSDQERIKNILTR